MSGPPIVVWLPAALVAAVAILPLVYLVVRSAGASPAAWEMVWRLRTLTILLNSIGLALAVTLATVAIALPLAWLTVRTNVPLRRAWTVILALPLVIPTYVGGFALVAALGPKGMLQSLLAEWLGLQRLPEIYGFHGAFVALTLFTYPYVFLTLRAGLQGLDPALEEASRSLGHSAWSTFRRITLPQLGPSMASGALLVALYTLSDFGAVSLLQYETFTRAIYLQYQGSFDRTMAALLALILVALTAVILFAEGRTRGCAHSQSHGARSSRPYTVVRLGRWLWAAFAYCVLIAVAGLAIPLLVLGYWLLRGVDQGVQFVPVWGVAANSVVVSAAAAVVAVVAALPVVVLSVRYRGRVSALIERGIYTSFALPAIVVALSLVFFGANYAPFIYQTLPLLVLAYVIRFLPQAIGAGRASLLQVNPAVEEAARGLGRTPMQVLATITVPLMRSGILTGVALVFLTTMKELPATLLLSPIGFKTLATSIWTATAEGFFAQAAAPALILVLVSGILMLVLARGEGAIGHEGRGSNG